MKDKLGKIQSVLGKNTGPKEKLITCFPKCALQEIAPEVLTTQVLMINLYK